MIAEASIALETTASNALRGLAPASPNNSIFPDDFMPSKSLSNVMSVTLRFPDPEISASIVSKSFAESIRVLPCAISIFEIASYLYPPAATSVPFNNFIVLAELSVVSLVSEVAFVTNKSSFIIRSALLAVALSYVL